MKKKQVKSFDSLLNIPVKIYLAGIFVFLKNYLSQLRTVFIILAFLYLRRKHAEGNTIVMLHRDFLSIPTKGILNL